MLLSPVSLYSNAIMTLDENGAPVANSSHKLDWNSDLKYSKNIDIIFRDPTMIYHYFHFCELSIAAFTMIATFMPAAKVQRVYVGSQRWNNADQNFVQQNIIAALFNPERIIEGRPEKNDAFSELVVDVDRYGPSYGDFNKYLEALLVHSKGIFPTLRSKVLNFAGVEKPDKLDMNNGSALYVKRGPPRQFAPGLEDQFLQIFSDRGIAFKTIDFSAMTWAEQVRSTSNARLMIGIHGNGFSNCLWMPPGATVLEIFPAEAHHYDFQMFSEIAGLNYFGIEGRAQYPYIFTAGSRFGGAYGDVGKPITELPLRWLGQIVDGFRPIQSQAHSATGLWAKIAMMTTRARQAWPLRAADGRLRNHHTVS